MQYLLIGLFSYWFACLSGITKTISFYLCKWNIYYTEYIPQKEVAKGIKTTKFFTKPKDEALKFGNRLPPFDCEKCLAFWLALSYSIYDGERWIEVILYSGCASLTAIVSAFVINKIRPWAPIKPF